MAYFTISLFWVTMSFFFFFFEGTSCVVASKYGTANVVFLKAMVTLCMWDVLMCK